MKKEIIYTYYEVELVNTPLDWNFTICESLDEVKNVLQFADVFLDDETRGTKVIVKGIGMTREAYNHWKKEKNNPF